VLELGAGPQIPAQCTGGEGRRRRSAELARMRNPRVTTDRTVDPSSLDSIIADVVRPGMSDEQKALALFAWWRQTVYHYGWPYMRSARMEAWQDPVKLINVHGYGLCGTHARVFGRLLVKAFGEGNARLIGYREAAPGAWRLKDDAGAFIDSVCLRDFERMRLMGHTACEARWSGRWRLIDPHVGFYAYLRGGEGVAGAQDLIADPTLVTDPARRVIGLMPCGDLSRVFYASEFINWGAITREAAPDDHAMEFSLRRGETYTRYWDRSGPFVWFPLMDERWDPGYLAPGPRHLCEGECSWRHYGNGELVYRPQLSDATYRDGVVVEQGLGEPGRRGLMPARAGRKAQVVFAVRLPYMISQATLQLNATRATGSDRVRVWVRPRGGGWRLVWDEPTCGRQRRTLDLSPWVVAKYGYDVRFDLKGQRRVEHAVLHAAAFQTRFLLNFLALPRLLPGRNRVTVEVANPAELRDRRLEVSYAWADRDGEHEDTREVRSSPCRYTLQVAPVLTVPAENPKYMRFLRMRLK
jgi:hypothetical protein